MGISERGTKAKSITSCDNAFGPTSCRYVSTKLSRKKHLLPQAAHRTPPGSSALRESAAAAAAAAANVYLCESEAAATNVYLCESEAAATNVYLCESEAAATNVLSVRKRSGSNKCFICAKAKRQQQMFYLCE
ncbi:hypothetical protein, partial [Lysinibacillus sphaericus]|uniref:hypothetical protein n=1 Tax=Lysinibacillus sphaericus TaxID=1421 RepID=UPI001CBE23D8